MQRALALDTAEGPLKVPELNLHECKFERYCQVQRSIYNKKLLVAPGITTRNKKLLVTSASLLVTSNHQENHFLYTIETPQTDAVAASGHAGAHLGGR